MSDSALDLLCSQLHAYRIWQVWASQAIHVAANLEWCIQISPGTLLTAVKCDCGTLAVQAYLDK